MCSMKPGCQKPVHMQLFFEKEIYLCQLFLVPVWYIPSDDEDSMSLPLGRLSQNTCMVLMLDNDVQILKGAFSSGEKIQLPNWA